MIDVPNFRDFGGYPSRFGGRLRSDALYRSGELAAADPLAIERLLGLDFALIADLRYAGERTHAPSPWPVEYEPRIFAHGAERKATAPHLALLASEDLDESHVVAFFMTFYTRLPFDVLYRPLFGHILKALADTEGRMLVHCAAGKDRTGILVGLLHYALGVSRDDIVADYMKSKGAPGLAGRAPQIAAEVEVTHGRRPPLGAVQKLLEVEPEYLAAAFGAIEAQCGSVDVYLDEMGVTEPVREALRARWIA
jgi:protein tyrosine/serine phosphatase